VFEKVSLVYIKAFLVVELKLGKCSVESVKAVPSNTFIASCYGLGSV